MDIQIIVICRPKRWVRDADIVAGIIRYANTTTIPPIWTDIDARHIYRQIDRAHRDFKPGQIEFLANIVRLYRGEKTENHHKSKSKLTENFPDGEYVDVPGLPDLVRHLSEVIFILICLEMSLL